MFHCQVKKEQNTSELINRKSSKKNLGHSLSNIVLSQSQVCNLLEDRNFYKKYTYQVSKKVLQYDQLQKKEMPPLSEREDIACMCQRKKRHYKK